MFFADFAKNYTYSIDGLYELTWGFDWKKDKNVSTHHFMNYSFF